VADGIAGDPAALSGLQISPSKTGLTLMCDLAIAREGGQHLLVSEVLAPCFELFRGVAEALAQLCQGFAR
jgi:hypothetical protein